MADRNESIAGSPNQRLIVVHLDTVPEASLNMIEFILLKSVELYKLNYTFLAYIV